MQIPALFISKYVIIFWAMHHHDDICKLLNIT